MSEFIVTSDITGGVVQAGHNTRRTLPGGLEQIKPRIVAALERLDYHVLGEEPIRAKRRASSQVIGKIYNSTVDLTIALKSTSAGSTQATFDYEVKSASMYKGDHKAIEREVDAVVALASRSGTSDRCHACGAETTGDSLFCRSCGSPSGGSPAELEVLRIEAESRFAHRSLITGGSIMATSFIAAMLLITYGSAKGISAGWAVLFLGQIASFLTLFFGSWVLHRALNPRAHRLDL